MNESINRVVKNLSKFIPYPDIEKSALFAEWKSRLLFFLLTFLVVFGLIAYIPSLILSLTEKLWAVAATDSFVYLAVIFIAFSKRISVHAKIIGTIIIFYILGVALLFLLGKEGAGFNWLFIFPVLSSFFYGRNGAIKSTLINVITLALLTLPVYFELTPFGRISEYGIAGWLVNSINFIIICSLISFSLAIIISSIDKSLQKEKELTHLLKENQEKLEVEKERAEESDRLKSTFLANMSHEIRTPMNSILGFSGLLTEPDLSLEKIKKYNRLIHLSGEQLMHIINDIIDISKIELNQMTIKYTAVDIWSCLKEIAEIQQNRINTLDKDLILKLDVPKELRKLRIQSDEFRFKQIVNNLAGNSVKYSEKGTITIGYTIKNSDKQPVIEFFVKDTGRGIPKEAQGKIFDRFTQADNVNFKEGTGLGLSITKGLLDLLGGNIWLRSEPGEGSEFYFTLPYIEASIAKNGELPLFTNSDLSEKILYIAEDDTFSMYFLRELLKPTNINIHQATNGKELLGLISRGTPDLILLDINMPIMDGFETITEIRKTHPDLPVIAQTAYAMAEERRKCMDLGCNDYIAKPLKKEQILQILNKYLT